MKPLEIVVVDDNSMFLKLSRAYLTKQGYTVKTFEHPHTALAYIEHHPAIAMLITDYLLEKGEMNGAELITNVKKMDPFLPCLCITAYNTAEIGREVTQHGGVDILLKPYEPKTLHNKVSSILRRQYHFPSDAPQKRVIVLKIGGSVLDQDYAHPRYNGLSNVIAVTEELQAEGYQIVVTIGSGPYGDIVKSRIRRHTKDDRRTARSLKEMFPLQIKETLDANLEFIRSLYRSNPFLFDPTSPADMQSLDDAVQRSRVILTATAPRHLTLEDERSPVQLLSESDYQTLQIAQFFGQTRIVIAKDTPGIYQYDPLRGEAKGIRGWWKAQAGNQRYDVVTAADLLSGVISRVGTDNQSNHLWEDAALRKMEKSDELIEVVVVCPEYSRFFHRGKPLLPDLSPTDLDDKTFLKQCLLDLATESGKYHQRTSKMVRSRPQEDN